MSGDFLVDKKESKDLVFIAGGIGVTPFRSIVKDIMDRGQKLNIKMFYCNKTAEAIAYKDLWSKAGQEIGMKTINVLAENEKGGDENGYLNEDILSKYEVSNKNTRFYISGPTAMVNSYEKLLVDYGVSKRNIITDYFPGLA